MEQHELTELAPYCATEKQRAVIDALSKHGSQRKAAKAVGISQSVLNFHLSRIRKQRARQDTGSHGVDNHHRIPEGYHIKGVSSYISDDDGNRHWIKTDRDRLADLELAKDLYSAMAEDVPRLPALPAPKHTEKDLLTLYPLADVHLGMLAWYREGGRDWDLKIAEEVVVDAVRRMIQRSDPAQDCIIGQLGDWTHFDGLKPLTPESRHVLDADGRPAKLAECSVRIMRTIIDDCLRHHDKVHLVLAEGNHDEGSSVIYRVLYRNLYENEPRLTVDDNPSPYYVHEHGATMLGFHHGHKLGPDQLPGLFASQYSEMWGRCKHRYAHCAHRHTESKIRDKHGMTVHQHSTLAARDAYASRAGYVGKSHAESVTYHKEFGQWSSVTINPKR